VAKDFSQRLGIGFDETFAPVIRIESVRTITARAAENEMVVRQFDVTTAYLNGVLKEKIFMEVLKYTKEALKVLVQAEATDSVIGMEANRMLQELKNEGKVC